MHSRWRFVHADWGLEGTGGRCSVLSLDSALDERVTVWAPRWPARTTAAYHVRPSRGSFGRSRGPGTSREARAASDLTPRESRPASHKPDPSALAARWRLRAYPLPRRAAHARR